MDAVALAKTLARILADHARKVNFIYSVHDMATFGLSFGLITFDEYDAILRLPDGPIIGPSGPLDTRTNPLYKECTDRQQELKP